MLGGRLVTRVRRFFGKDQDASEAAFKVSVAQASPVIGRPNADILHHKPPPAYAHGLSTAEREACWLAGGAEAWPQVHPGRRRARGTRGGRPVSGSRRAGGLAGWRAGGLAGTG
jgi:hypothetical protein